MMTCHVLVRLTRECYNMHDDSRTVKPGMLSDLCARQGQGFNLPPPSVSSKLYLGLIQFSKFFKIPRDIKSYDKYIEH